MALEFLNDTPQRAFRKLERDLLLVNPKVDLRQYKNMTPRALGEELEILDDVERTMLHEQTYGSWLSDDKYVEHRLLKEAITFLKDYKNERREEEVLVPGYTYYRQVKQFGSNLSGHRCYFREGANADWAPFNQPVAAMKAFEVLRHGSNDDFRTIYIEMADGRLNSLQKVSLEHLTESSKDALESIEKYCDGRWTGPWTWEIPSPYTLRENIEERNQMRHQPVSEMQGQFEQLLVKLNEADMDKYEVIASAEEMSSTIEKMVQQIARLGGEGIIVLKDQIRVAMGDEAAEQIEDKFVEPVRAAADALSKLRATIDSSVQKLKAGDLGGDEMGGGLGGDELGGGLGSPEDALGGGLDDELGDPADDALAGDLAGVGLDGGDDGERPMKDM
jgi:hypothetical protein